MNDLVVLSDEELVAEYRRLEKQHEKRFMFLLEKHASPDVLYSETEIYTSLKLKMRNEMVIRFCEKFGE